MTCLNTTFWLTESMGNCAPAAPNSASAIIPNKLDRPLIFTLHGFWHEFRKGFREATDAAFSAPILEFSGMPPGDFRPILLFDAECRLCVGVVKFLLRRDRGCLIRFASLQSDAGQGLLREWGVPEERRDSVILLEAGEWTGESTASLRVVRFLPVPWRLGYALIAIPRPVRDVVYRWVSRNRYRWFGKRKSAWIFPPEWRERFL